MNRDKYIFEQINNHYKDIKDKYEVVGIFLQGSQNYGLDIYDDDYKSDIDTKAIILPSFEDVVYNREPISTTFVRENNEHIDIKDIRIMFNVFKKQNVNFIETLFTKYKIINPKYKDIFQAVLDNREKIARLDFNKALNCQYGMSEQKFVALKHPYPTIIDKINKYGYDPKQLHHILRMNDFIKKYIEGMPYEKCLIPDNKERLIEIKKGVLPLNEAEQMAKEINKETYDIAKKNIQEENVIDKEAVKVLDDTQYLLLKQRFQEELTKKEDKIFIPNKIFVTSDNHFYHKNIIDFENRPFSSIEEMNEELIKEWNSVVDVDDLVYILGDFSFGNRQQTSDILDRLKGKKFLVLGNHDDVIKSSHFDKSKFIGIDNYKELNYKGINFVMCHYPFASNDHTKFQLYGHIHSNRGEHTVTNLPSNSFNVGIDVNNYKPVNIDEIVKIAKDSK